MAVSYSVRFKKMSLSGKIIVEKEGEVVFDRRYFRLKGKGANDHGEIVNFTDLKEIRADKDQFVFLTFAKEKFELSRFGSDFERFLEDFYRVKNDYFAENMFMKAGMLIGQFECFVDIVGQMNKSISKGKSIVQFYEESIVFIPKYSDAFSVNLSFMKHHQFDEDEYVLTIETDSGSKIFVSKLGSSFEEAREVLEKRLEKMYQKVLNHLNQVLPGFSLQTLLKLAYAVRNGRAVAINSLKKIDAGLPAKVMELAFKSNPELEQKVQFIRSLDKDEKLFVGFSLQEDTEKRDVCVRAWFLAALPNMNTIALGITNNSNDNRIFFFRIVMEQGIASDKLEGKVLEINQCMVLFDYDLTPLLKDKNELRKTRYRVAILRMAFLRLFRRSMLGYSQANDLEKFKNDANRYFAMAGIMKRPHLRHRQIFKPSLK